MGDSFDVVVIGAGQAGLAISYYLTNSRVRHIVLERGAIGESWRTQRWDSFCLNTPNWCNGLPGMEFGGDAPHGFGHRDELVTYFERYARTFDLPVRERTRVTSLRRLSTGSYATRTEAESFDSTAVVLATGSMSRPRLPNVADAVPDGIVSVSAGDYRNAATLPAGSVIVVGSGQSGCQIAEDLVEAGRTVYMCASRVGRVPRRYRGRDILEWWSDMGFLDVAVDELEDSSVQFATQPQVSGTQGGHTVSLQSLARDGVTLLGRASAFRGTQLVLEGDLLDSIAFADQKAHDFKAAIDEWIEQQDVEAEPSRPDPGEPPLPDLQGSEDLRELDLRDARVGSIIWCTGFDADWTWVDVDVFESNGQPRHVAGVTDARGLYFIGHPWLSRRGSGILHGVKADAARIVEHMRREVLGKEVLNAESHS